VAEVSAIAKTVADVGSAGFGAGGAGDVPGAQEHNDEIAHIAKSRQVAFSSLFIN
jgi:hypothetical protein